MATIRHFSIVPPGGWRYVQPETGVWFHENSYDELVAAVKAHRAYKALTTETLELDIQRQLCAGLNCEHCKPEPGEDYRPVVDLTASLTTAKAVKLSASVIKALGAFAAGGFQFVPRETAQARAAICRGCPFNKPATLCACTSVYKTVEAMVPTDRKEPGVSVCMACGCSLQAKINLPDAVIAASLPPDLTLPDWCWQKSSRDTLAAS